MSSFCMTEALAQPNEGRIIPKNSKSIFNLGVNGGDATLCALHLTSLILSMYIKDRYKVIKSRMNLSTHTFPQGIKLFPTSHNTNAFDPMFNAHLPALTTIWPDNYNSRLSEHLSSPNSIFNARLPAHTTIWPDHYNSRLCEHLSSQNINKLNHLSNLILQHK